MWYVIIYRNHKQEEIACFETEEQAIEFRNFAISEPGVFTEIIYEEER